MNCHCTKTKSKITITSVVLAVILAFVIPFSALFSENILLRKGGIIKGKVVDQDDKKLKVQKEDGSTVNISKGDILKVVYKEHISAEEEEKLRKAEEAKAKALADKEKLLKDKADAEAAEKERLASENDRKLREETEAKDKEAQRKEQEKWEKEQASLGQSLTRKEAVLSSAVLPGWGQYKQGRKISSYIYPSLIALGLYFTYDSHRMYLNAKRDYNNLNNPYSETGLLQAALGTPSQSMTGPPVDPVSALVANETSAFEGQRENVERHFRQTQAIASLTLGIYVFQLLDALVFHPTPAGKPLAFLEPNPDSKERFLFKTQMERVDPISLFVPGSAFIENKTRLGIEIHF